MQTCNYSRCLKRFEKACSRFELKIGPEDPLEASPLRSKVALADSVEDPLEASPLRSKVALVDSVENPLEAHLFAARRLRSPNRGLYVGHGLRTTLPGGVPSHYLQHFVDGLDVGLYVAYFKRKTFFSLE